MKKYLSGFITGALATICMFIFLGASQIEDDSLKVMLGRIDAYLSGDTTIGPSGRATNCRVLVSIVPTGITYWIQLLENCIVWNPVARRLMPDGF